LKEAGPDAGTAEDTTGGIAVEVLNAGLRSFLAKWHPELEIWKHKTPEADHPFEHERKWVHSTELRNKLKAVQKELVIYLRALKAIVDARPVAPFPLRVWRGLSAWAFGYDLFISYTRGRGDTTCELPTGNALGYAADLERRLADAGYTCFRDDSEIVIGDPLSDRIFAALDRSRMLIVLGSKGASDAPWVRQEVNRFKDGPRGWNHRLLYLFPTRLFAWLSDLLLNAARTLFRSVATESDGTLSKRRELRIVPVRFGNSMTREKLAERLGIGTTPTLDVEERSDNLMSGTVSSRVINQINKRADFIRIRSIARASAALVLGAMGVLGWLYNSSVGESEGASYLGIAQTITPDARMVDMSNIIQHSWHRGHIVELFKSQLDYQANPGNDMLTQSRRATVATILVLVGQSELVWSHLRYDADPTLRVILIRRLATGGVPPQTLANALYSVEVNADLRRDPKEGIRQALILILGRFDVRPLKERVHLAPTDVTLEHELSDNLIRWMTRTYLDDPDPGVHSAIEWALRRWGAEEIVDKSDNESREKVTATAVLDWRKTRYWGWYMGPKKHTMAIIEPVNAGDAVLAISTKEVTYGQFEAFWNDAQRQKHGGKLWWTDALPNECAGPDRPVTRIRVDEAQSYCEWLPKGVDDGKSEKGPHHRLPSRQEWGAALRGGTPGPAFYGQAINVLDDHAWLLPNAHRFGPLELPMAVRCGGLMPNPYGLFDIVGNAREFCSDPIATNSGRFVLCGGSAGTPPGTLGNEPEQFVDRDDDSGFRIAITLAPREGH
jgi:hypothetical protein